MTLYEVSTSAVSIEPIVAEATTAEVAVLFALHPQTITQMKNVLKMKLKILIQMRKPIIIP